ncbi:hypothetical protein FGG08_000335 [Glutinoglossum americanum]|uniref:DNA-directed RNA polymerase, mitochondrial n=1 Tax=Glutinoglossum americanum TaxID=1670608 RepID=A0A9P8IAA2_9PEZI|nr:hypothetical protein FGG08_000335 [Glutinoglossum americanum]
MLVRAAKRKVQRDALQHFNIPLEQLYLPWLCPAQMRYRSYARLVSAGPRSRRSESNRDLSVCCKRSLATAAVAEFSPLPGEYIPFEGLPPAYATKSSQANWLSPRSLSSLRPFDPSSTIVINRSVAVERRFQARNGSGGDLAEIKLTLNACLRVDRLERAATLVRRLASIYTPDSEELLDSHNQYIRASLEYAIKTRHDETYKSIQKWFEVEMRSKGVRPDATTYALLVKGALLFLRGPKIERTVRRYMELATEAGGGVKLEVLSMPILSDPDIYKVTEMCPTEFPKDDQYVPEISESQSSYHGSPAEFNHHVPEVKPARQKGLGLAALKKSLSIFGDSQIPYPHDMEGTDEDRDRAYALARQGRLEEDAVNSAIERWREENEILRKMGVNSNFKTRTLGALMWSWYDDMVPLIKKELECVEDAEKRCSRSQVDQERCLYGPFIRIAQPEKLAAVAILGFMSTLSSQGVEKGVKMLNAMKHVGRLAEDESMAEIIKDESYNDIWGNIRTSERRQKLDSLMRKNHDLFLSLRRHASNKQKELPDGDIHKFQPWNTAIRLRVGGLLASLLIRVAKVPVVREHPETGEKVSQNQPAFFHTYQYQQGKKVGILMVNSFLGEKMRLEPVRDALAKNLPMIVAPKKWTSFGDGGFLKNSSEVMRIKGGYSEQREYALAAAEKGDLDQVFAGLDVLAKTPWRINRPVFDVMLEVWNSGEAIADIPPSDPKLEYPPEPNSDDPAERRRWLRAMKDVENQKGGLHSQRCFQNFQLEIARAFLWERLYFPHNLDFRGRAYPIPPYLNHMGADNCRGLLIFAEGKELGVAGLNWLKVHVANVFGYDKASFKEREEFSAEHLADIYDSAVNPLNGKRWWLKAEDPWQCLAACIELKNALDSPQPTRFKSHLAIHQDGTCNGLQHYAALGGDMWGARQVNLEPGERPADIYTTIAELVKKEISVDAAEGDAIAKHLDGKITRKVVKQTVMTNVYGVTFAGARAQVRKQLEEIVPAAPGLGYGSLSSYVARKIFKCLSSMFNGAHDIQYWLGECAKRISQSLTREQIERLEMERKGDAMSPSNVKRELGSRGQKLKVDHAQFKSTVVWTTPLKIPVVQPYRSAKPRVVTTSLQRVSIVEPRASDPTCRRKQAQAFPPNFIHSLDATHMLLSALRCDEAGLTFSAVHDSFWTHACDVDTMNHILRDAFVQIHSEDVIARLAAEFKARYKGCMYLAQVPAQSALGKKITSLRRQKVRTVIGKRTINGKININELLMERERLRLLESDDPENLEEGRKMITPGSLFSETADNHKITELEVASATLGSMTDQATVMKSGQPETETSQSPDMEVVEPVAKILGSAPELMGVGLDAEGEEDEVGGREEEEHVEKVGKGSKYPKNLSVWVPLTFPPVPKKGDFDVSRLKDMTHGKGCLDAGFNIEREQLLSASSNMPEADPQGHYYSMEGEGVAGAVLINSSTARGVATEADATFLTVAVRRSLDNRGIGAATYRDLCVLSLPYWPLRVLELTGVTARFYYHNWILLDEFMYLYLAYGNDTPSSMNDGRDRPNRHIDAQPDSHVKYAWREFERRDFPVLLNFVARTSPSATKAKYCCPSTMPVVKGGVWTNIEDEILKASVSKYGLNQWARVSSLLARKTPKQCKARWSEWLDPGIRKIEWSKEEDEKLLHLAKLMPTQWRTIAPIVGRTATQCLERYQKLLDEAEARENDELGLGGPDGGETSAPSADDVRKLRPGELDPDPESKPARPDTIDLDEDEKEMLSEARARLANTQGKKAKRKARERQLEESRRLAVLQKRRELKNAGINIKVVNRKKGEMDYNADIPFEKKAAPGFFDTQEEDLRNERQREAFDPRKQQLQNKRKGDQDEDNDRKRRKNDKSGSSATFAAAAKAGQMQKIREAEQSSKRRSLVLPAPQVGETELEEIVKMGMIGERANRVASASDNEATRGLIGNYSTINTGTPIRTPRAPPQEDHIANEIRNIRALTETQSSLLGGDNTPLHEGSGSTGFEGIAPRKQQMATPNPLATPFRTGPVGGVGATPLRTPMVSGATPLRTPRDNFAINEHGFAVPMGGETPREVKLRELALKHQLKNRLASLPKPKETEWELELPEQQEEAVVTEDLSEEDAAIRDRRNQELHEAQERAEFRRRTQVMQRALPRPSVVDIDALLKRASNDSNGAEEAIAKEMVLLIANDALKYPITGGNVKGTPRPLDALDDEALNKARMEIVLELPVEDAQREEFEQAWIDLHESAGLPGLSGYSEDEVDDLQLMVKAFDTVQEDIMRDAEKGNKIEKKLSLHLGGYQKRATVLRKKVLEAADALEKARTGLDTFRTLQIAEEAAIPRRLEGLRAEVEFVARREREAQQLYRARKEELDGLGGVNGYQCGVIVKAIVKVAENELGGSKSCGFEALEHPSPSLTTPENQSLQTNKRQLKIPPDAAPTKCQFQQPKLTERRKTEMEAEGIKAPESSSSPETSRSEEELIEKFQFERVLRQDHSGLRMHLLGTIPPSPLPALLTLERAPLATHPPLPPRLAALAPLGSNSIYHWYLGSPRPPSPSGGGGGDVGLKLNLIYPCDEGHVRKYSAQGARVVRETAEDWGRVVEGWVRGRARGGVEWVRNVVEGRREEGDVLLREGEGVGDERGFVLVPDLNWDRKTPHTLHLLAIPYRTDLLSLRDLRKSHIPWLRHMRSRILAAATSLYPSSLDQDQLKLYLHYHPTHYHLHIHLVHTALDAGSTQAVGKAFGLENLIAWLESLPGGDEAGLCDVEITYTVGEESALWKEVWGPLKEEKEREREKERKAVEGS